MSLARQIKPKGEGTPEAISTGEYRSIDLHAIRLDQSAQPRESLNTERTAEYAEAMKAGDKFPSLIVFFDGETYWLADGFHRHYAAQQAGIKALSCRVLPGGLRDAILWSVGANAKHGLARSQADKERAVLRLLSDDEWSQWSDREIAKRCHVDHKTVARIRKDASGEFPQIERKVQRGGTVYTQKVAKAKPASPKALENKASKPLVDENPASGDHKEEIASQTLAPQGVGGGDEPEKPVEEITPDRSVFKELVALWKIANDGDRQDFKAFIRGSEAAARLNPPSTAPTVEPEATPSPPPASGTPSNPQPVSLTTADKAEASTSSPSASATPFAVMSKADQIRLIRPYCQHLDDLDKCGGSGRNHCPACKKAMAEGEAA